MVDGMSQLVRLREIEGIYRPPGLHWVGDGFRVAGYFSAIPDVVQKLDPFLLLDYHPEHVYAPTAETCRERTRWRRRATKRCPRSRWASSTCPTPVG